MTQVTSTTGFTQNSVARAEAQLAGVLSPDLSTPGPGPNGSYTATGIINWANNMYPTHIGAAIGNFQTNSYGSGWPYPNYPDQPFPGIAVTNSFTDNLAAEIFAYLQFDTAGYYRFGINSDDAFALQVGTPGVTNGTVMASVDAGKGSSDIPVSFTVPQAGLYPIRLVYYNGGGGANLEYFSYDDNGSKIPINDTNNPAAIKAYYNINTTPQLMFTSATLTGGTTLTIDWTGTGRLQEASILTGHASDWTDVSNPPKPYSVQVGTTGQKFYRLISP